MSVQNVLYLRIYVYADDNNDILSIIAIVSLKKDNREKLILQI